jgi:hypothetical protein
MDNYAPKYIVSHPTRLEYSPAPLWGFQIGYKTYTFASRCMWNYFLKIRLLWAINELKSQYQFANVEILLLFTFFCIYTKLSTCGIIWFLDFAHCVLCQEQHKVTDIDIQFPNYYFGIPQTMDKVQKPDDPKRKIPCQKHSELPVGTFRTRLNWRI